MHVVWFFGSLPSEHWKNTQDHQSEMDDILELEVDGVDLQELARHIEVADMPASVDEMTSGTSTSARTKKAREPACEDVGQSTVTTIERNAHFLGVEASFDFHHGNSFVHVVFVSCLSAGMFAYVYDSSAKKELLGQFKTPHGIENSNSIECLCKVHKPVRSCSCWVTCHSQAAKQNVLRDLLKWLAVAKSLDKQEHMQESVNTRIAHGMRVRKTKQGEST